MRKVIAVALSFAIQATALSAPLVHAHPDDHATEHHGRQAIHAHWAGHVQSHHSSNAPGLETSDHDRAVFLNTFVAVTSVPLPAFGLTHALFELPVPAERTAHRLVEIVRSHDPPCSRSLTSRAPPPFLS